MVEHFKIWDVSPVESKHGVKLLGQFDREQPWGATIDTVLYIGNPVNKTHGDTQVKVQDERNHLVGYRLKADEPRKHVRVSLMNQFTRRPNGWLLGQPSLLLLPAAKAIAP